MPPAELTVAVPTFNRAALLKQTLESILKQSFQNFVVVVFDNASTDNTQAVIESFSDPRLSFSRSQSNLGMVNNWNRCILENTSPYLCIFHDDDLMLDGFLAQTHAMMESHPTMGFCYTRAQLIDAAGRGYDVQPPEHGVPEGEMPGDEFLERVISGRQCMIYPSGVLYRASALAKVGGYDSPHSKGNLDRNLFYRLAKYFSVGHVPHHLFASRQHTGQFKDSLFRATGGAGMIGAFAERLDGVAYLMDSEKAASPAYRRWLAERLLMLHRQESAEIHRLIPSHYWSWQEQFEMAKRELDSVIPAGAGFILVDEDTWGVGNSFRGRHVWPFLEKDGVFWGAPVNQSAAVTELERVKQSGARFIVFTWDTFWWLDFYSELDRHLSNHSECLLRSPRVLVFNLAPSRSSQ